MVADAPARDEGGGTRILPGESAGEQAVLDDAVDSVAMTALEDSELLVIESSTVWALIERSHVVARNLTEFKVDPTTTAATVQVTVRVTQNVDSTRITELRTTTQVRVRN